MSEEEIKTMALKMQSALLEGSYQMYRKLEKENAQLKEEIECLKGKSEAQDILLKKENFGKLYQCNVRLESVLKEIREYIKEHISYEKNFDGIGEPYLGGYDIRDLLEIIDKGLKNDE